MMTSSLPTRSLSFHEQGYLKLPGFISAEEVYAISRELDEFLNDPSRLPVRPPPFHSLSSPSALEALRESTHGVYLFGPSQSQVDTVGHGVHRVKNSATRRLAMDARVCELCVDIGGMKDPRIVQSKFVMKPAKWGALVPAHADEQYIFTRPSSGLALWIPLEPSNEENGTLQVLPRSHLEFKRGPSFWCDEESAVVRWVQREFSEEDDDLEREDVDDHLTSSSSSHAEENGNDDANKNGERTTKRDFPFSKKQQRELDWLAIPCAPGDCVVMHHGLLHMSLPNRSNHSRRAFTLHIVDGSCEFIKGNWLMGGELGFERVGGY